ncbi:WD40-repeat-containing domain protein [Jimgerdemannia flammicorona]|uniref:WD40-repeat-containing domain protein n=1 Tax=Jimgerdemannia flammicorona TaxID=994334 RepID=A0A433QP15_9FUNG|nr:WD40-repeat-containing domain protein [Jimgerdemannia flammicorona]
MQPPDPDPIPFSPHLFGTLKIAKLFRHSTKPITSLSFDDTGEVCVCSAEDESLRVYDCKQGKQNNVIYASTKEDGKPLIRDINLQRADTLRYLSLHDNKYIRYFKGHRKRYVPHFIFILVLGIGQPLWAINVSTFLEDQRLTSSSPNRVVALEMSPLDDQVLSAAIDDTVRLWDLRSSACQGLINISGRPTVAFDQSGLVFAVGLDSNTIRVYDLKAFDKGPFDTWTIDSHLPYGIPPPEWTGLRFSNDGKHILVTTAGDSHLLIDSFTGQSRQRFVGHNGVGSARGGGEAGFTPDGRFVASGRFARWHNPHLGYPEPDPGWAPLDRPRGPHHHRRRRGVQPKVHDDGQRVHRAGTLGKSWGREERVCDHSSPASEERHQVAGFDSVGQRTLDPPIDRAYSMSETAAGTTCLVRFMSGAWARLLRGGGLSRIDGVRWDEAGGLHPQTHGSMRRENVKDNERFGASY